MAGFFAIISKGKALSSLISERCKLDVYNALGSGPEQQVWQHQSVNVYICSVAKIGEDPLDSVFVDSDNKVLYIVDGFVHNRGFEEISRKNTFCEAGTTISTRCLDHKDEFIKHMQGSFNIVCHDLVTGDVLLANDRFGFYPLFYYENDTAIVVSSKLSGIIASKTIKDIAFDYASIAEHLLFNYVVSENTYIKGIHTLPGASILRISQGEVTARRYWDISEVFDYPAMSKRDSFEAIDAALSGAAKRVSSLTSDMVSLSFTGGWDSRLVLSYLHPEFSSRLKLFSFGASGSPDIEIPRYISEQEALDYTPFILGQDYLDNEFLDAAKQTILLSGGARSYKRAHYLFSIKRMSCVSKHLITGIFGDELFKVGKPIGCEVISHNLIDLIDNSFKINVGITGSVSRHLNTLFNCDTRLVEDELVSRMHSLGYYLKGYGPKPCQYFGFRFYVNLRKYFGFEASSYNDFVYCYSPFIDFGFFQTYMHTCFAGFRYSFKPQGYGVRKQTTELYAKLIIKNNMHLASYTSARGYSMCDTISVPGKLKIALNRFRPGRIVKDGFNTSGTDSLFYKGVCVSFDDRKDLKHFESSWCNNSSLLSLWYWMKSIQLRKLS